MPTTPSELPAEPELPVVHVVQEGETLTAIAELYGTDVDTLLLLNSITEPSLIFVGQEISLPGSEDQPITSVHFVRLGDNLAGLAAEYQTSIRDIAEQNQLIQGDRLVAGRSIIIRSSLSEPMLLAGMPHIVKPGETLLTVAAKYQVSPAVLVDVNGLSYPAYLFAGQRLRIPDQRTFYFLSNDWRQLSLLPLPLSQGSSALLFSESNEPVAPSGKFMDQELPFTAYDPGFISLVGIDAFTSPGVYEIELASGAGDGTVSFSQPVVVESSAYLTQTVTIPEDRAYLLEPEIRRVEDEFLASIYSRVSDDPLWDGPFQLPVTGTIVSAPYGGARSYNDSPVEIYHTGVDFAGFVGTEIRAPAPGTVVFSDTLTLRGQTIILDHGLGVMTGYYHLSATQVAAGDSVSQGQVIALAGSTGLSTGPHLHWDLRIRNVPVDPIPWTEVDILDWLPKDDFRGG